MTDNIQLIDIGDQAADSIDVLLANLHRRVIEQSETLLREQFVDMGIDPDDVDLIADHGKRVSRPEEEMRLFDYYWDETLILSVKIADNWMAIEFDRPNLKGEVS